MSKPVVLQVGSYPEWDQDPLDAAYDMKRLFEAEDHDAFLAEHGPQVQAIATRSELGADAKMLAACPNCGVISVYGVGFDAVALDAYKAQGIRVTNTPDVLTGDVADLRITMMLFLSRGVIGAEQWVKGGFWAAKGLYPLKQRVLGAKSAFWAWARLSSKWTNACRALIWTSPIRTSPAKTMRRIGPFSRIPWRWCTMPIFSLSLWPHQPKLAIS